MLRPIGLFNFIFREKLCISTVSWQVGRSYCSVPALKSSTDLHIKSQLTKEEELEVEQNLGDSIIDFDLPNIPIPEYPKRKNETLQKRKHRLTYQSRKRGMLENDLILATFAGKYMKDMSEELTAQYDNLINGVTNEWDIFNWATDAKPTPPEYNNEIMKMLKEHVKNTACEKRLRIPKLDYFNYF